MPPTPDSRTQAVSIEQLVHAERVALLYRLTPLTLATALLFSAIVCFALWRVAPREVLIGWVVALNAVSLIRYLDILAYRRAQPPPAEVDRWLRRFVVLTAGAGSLWGMMGTLLYPSGDPTYQAIVCVFLIGTAAVGLFTLNSSWIAYATQAVTVLLPPTVFMIFRGNDGNPALGAALAFFLVLVLVNSRRSVRTTTEMLTLRFVNARIAAERESALHAAEAAGRARLQFLANMSHEIRTPLNGILGMAQLLQSSPLDTVQRHRLDAVHSSGLHLLALVNDVLDFSKIEAGKLDIDCQPFELRRAVRGVLDLLTTRAEERGLTLECSVASGLPEWVLGDVGRLKQVLNNLIGNAIKFTDHGRVSVRIAALTGDPSQAKVRFEVRDTGIGIATADQANLFEMFRQVDASAARRHGGTGLGLAISKQLTELMQGEIGFESAAGRGSTFWFAVPLPAAEAPAPEPANREPLAQRRFQARILLVEDNPVNREIALAMLEEMGLAVAHAEDGRQGVAAAKNERFDLILMDCQMPEMDGFEATGHLLAHERAHDLAHVPIVALTANAIRGDREDCIAAGMDDYLAKPFGRHDLAEVLSRWLPAP